MQQPSFFDIQDRLNFRTAGGKKFNNLQFPRIRISRLLENTSSGLETTSVLDRQEREAKMQKNAQETASIMGMNVEDFRRAINDRTGAIKHDSLGHLEFALYVGSPEGKKAIERSNNPGDNIFLPVVRALEQKYATNTVMKKVA